MAGADPVIALRGAPNFRDVGGLPTRDGRSVRCGALFRSGHLGELHAQDIALLQSRLGQDVWVVDLRGATEREKLPCLLPQATVHSLPIEPSVAQKLLALQATGERLAPAVTCRMMAQAYEGFVRGAQPQLAAFLNHALARAGKPLVVHCAAGKDRTGFMVAMLLGALGVPRAAILQDYLRTNERVTPRDSARFAPEIMQVLGTVRAEFLAAALDLVERESGGIEGYLDAVGFRARERALLRSFLA